MNSDKTPRKAFLLVDGQRAVELLGKAGEFGA